MIHEIEVHSVFQINDCAGKASFYITRKGDPGSFLLRWALTSQYMDPLEKLRLASVKPGQKAYVRNNADPDGVGAVWGNDQDLSSLGIFIDIEKDYSPTPPLCRCGKPLTTDGFRIYCPNTFCHLTLLARIQRLAQCRFFDKNHTRHWGEYNSNFLDVQEYPFVSLLESHTWGRPELSLEEILNTNNVGHLTMATLLVGPLFQEFCDEHYRKMDIPPHAMYAIGDFYGAIIETSQRRLHDCPRQDLLLCGFMWSLGIQSLRKDVICKILTYEKAMGLSDDVMISYAYLLANPVTLSAETGIHLLEAQTISSEFHSRYYEMFDIFGEYCSHQAMNDIFTISSAHRR